MCGTCKQGVGLKQVSRVYRIVGLQSQGPQQVGHRAMRHVQVAFRALVQCQEITPAGGVQGTS